MAHVFISYAHNDLLNLVADLKSQLKHEGFEVWNDEELLFGEEWELGFNDHLS